jgi:hypothetical protein
MIMRTLHIIFATWIFLTVADSCNAKAWRGIVPLKSTRADVERLLGPSTGVLPRYYLSDSTVDFKYATCRCGDKCENNDWNVPLGTVTVIRVGLKGVVKIADLRIDLSKFKKEAGDPDVPGHFYYVNEGEGFAIDTGGDYVSALIYGPRAKDDYLRCRHNSSQPKKHKPNCYSMLTFCDSSSALIEAGDSTRNEESSVRPAILRFLLAKKETETATLESLPGWAQ